MTLLTPTLLYVRTIPMYRACERSRREFVGESDVDPANSWRNNTRNNPTKQRTNLGGTKTTIPNGNKV
jgi:hypothetical protein